jgi:acetyl-CoA synthetase
MAASPWNEAWSELGGLPDHEHGVNLADVVLGRHVREGRGDRIAIRWLGRDPDDLDDPVDLTFRGLDQRSSRFASAMRRHGFAPGTGVATLIGRVPDLYVTVLGAWKAQGVVTPLFSAFGPRPVEQRMRLARARILVTTPVLFRRTVADVLDRLPDLELVLVCGATEDQTARATDATGSVQVVSMGSFLSEGSDTFEIAGTDPEQPALLLATSGTTGYPKGVVHVHGGVVAHHLTGRLALGLRDGDVFWCTADPGWVTGTSYGIIAPLAAGVTSVVDEADFDAQRWMRVLEQHSVNVLYTSPTALRMLHRAAIDPPPLPSLRRIATVGEALDAATVRWAEAAFGAPVVDTWWQTETGSIMIANTSPEFAGAGPAGAMGRPLPGVEATVLARDADGDLLTDADGSPIEVPDGPGELAVGRTWPSLFRGYAGDDDRYRRAFSRDWYRTGDIVRRDDDGCFWFVGRGDDLIKTAGHFVGPAEVEAVLDEHPAVEEAAVIGAPDPTAGSIVRAVVVVARGRTADDDLRRELLAYGRSRLGAAIAPREVAFANSLPHNLSGKILRRTLVGAATDPTGTGPGRA